MSKETIKNIVFIVMILIIASAIIFVYNYKTKDKFDTHLKNYKVNEYIPTYVSEEDMAKIYLNDYLNNVIYDIKKSYELVDNDYKSKKFSNYEEYKNYVIEFITKDIKMTKYSIYNTNGYTIYVVYDNYENVFIFKTKGVMQYSVYFDDYTVEIG